MKTFLLSFICILSFNALSTAQEASLNDFKRAYNHRDGIHSFTVPGFLVRMVGNIALHDEDKIDREAIKPLMRNIGSVSVFIAEDLARVDLRDLNRLKDDMANEDYEPLLSVRDAGDDVEIYSWTRKDIIRRIVFFVHDGSDSFVMVNIRGYFTPDDLSEMINKYKDGKDYKEGSGLKKL